MILQVYQQNRSFTCEVRKSVIITSFNVPLLKIIPIATRTFCQSIVLFFT